MSVVIHNFFISFVMHYLEQWDSRIFFCYYCRLLTFNLIHLSSTKNVKNKIFIIYVTWKNEAITYQSARKPFYHLDTEKSSLLRGGSRISGDYLSFFLNIPIWSH